MPPLRWPLQAWAVRWLMTRGTVTVSANGSVHGAASAHWPPGNDNGVIDGEFREIEEDDDKLPPGGAGRGS